MSRVCLQQCCLVEHLQVYSIYKWHFTTLLISFQGSNVIIIVFVRYYECIQVVRMECLYMHVPVD